MSQRGKRGRGKLSAQPARAADMDFDDDDIVMQVPKPSKKNTMAVNNEAAKSKLSVVIDILTYDDNNFNEQTLRHNVQIAVKHLLAVKELL